MDLFHVLLDAPGEPTSRLQIAKLGTFKDKRYGEFSITQDDVADWKHNLEHLPDHRALIDQDHAADRSPRNTEASGWITNVDLVGDKVMADIEWTSKGEDAIRDKRYLFFSPTYGPHKTEDGNVHDNTLIGGALTNRPFLNMPAITLASDDRLLEALEQDPAARFHQRALDGDFGEVTQALVLLDVNQAERDKAKAAGHSLPDGSYPINNTEQLHAAAVLAASKHGDYTAARALIRQRAKDLGVDITTLPGFSDESETDSKSTSDSRRTMDKDILTLLGLAEDTDVNAVLDALKQLQSELAESREKVTTLEAETPEQKTLDQLAEEAGKVVLDGATVADMLRKANLGEEAHKELEQAKFTTSFERAVREGRAVPAQLEQFTELHDTNPELAMKMLDSGPQIVNTKPTNWNNGHQELGDAPSGVDAESHKLDAAVKARLKELGKPMSEYTAVYELIMQEGGH